jgi:hypothetical protein
MDSSPVQTSVAEMLTTGFYMGNHFIFPLRFKCDTNQYSPLSMFLRLSALLYSRTPKQISTQVLTPIFKVSKSVPAVDCESQRGRQHNIK